MNRFVFPPPDYPFLPVVGQRAVFPVGRIFCVGQNYAAHAAEMGAIPVPNAAPFFFSKPVTALAHDGDAIPYPPQTAELHHEVELVAAIGLGGSDIPAGKALAHVFGYTVGLDLTRRDLQAEAKKAGRPWDLAKGFDRAAPMGAVIPAAEVPGDEPRGRILLSVNGAIRQDGDLQQMIHGVGALVSALSRFITLQPGDVLMTGTPAGVGPLLPGDKVDAHIDHIGDLSVTIK